MRVIISLHLMLSAASGLSEGGRHFLPFKLTEFSLSSQTTPAHKMPSPGLPEL